MHFSCGLAWKEQLWYGESLLGRGGASAHDRGLELMIFLGPLQPKPQFCEEFSEEFPLQAGWRRSGQKGTKEASACSGWMLQVFGWTFPGAGMEWWGSRNTSGPLAGQKDRNSGALYICNIAFTSVGVWPFSEGVLGIDLSCLELIWCSWCAGTVHVLPWSRSGVCEGLGSSSATERWDCELWALGLSCCFLWTWAVICHLMHSYFPKQEFFLNKWKCAIRWQSHVQVLLNVLQEVIVLCNCN